VFVVGGRWKFEGGGSWRALEVWGIEGLRDWTWVELDVGRVGRLPSSHACPGLTPAPLGRLRTLGCSLNTAQGAPWAAFSEQPKEAKRPTRSNVRHRQNSDHPKLPTIPNVQRWAHVLPTRRAIRHGEDMLTNKGCRRGHGKATNEIGSRTR